MRRLNLKDYTVSGKVLGAEGKPIEITGAYHVKDSLLNLMFTRELQLTSAELVKQNMLAMKLEGCKDDEVLLEDEEWGRLKRAVDAFKGFNRNDVELVTRVNEAEQVDMLRIVKD